MRRSMMSLIAFTAFALACAPAQAPPPPVDLAADEQAVRAISKQWLELDRAKDMASIAALFAEDGVLIRQQEEPIVGHAAIEAHMTKQQTENPTRVPDWSTERVEVAASGDLAVEYGTWSETGLGPNGTEEDHGRYVTVFRKVNGAWKIAADASLSTEPEVAASPSN